MSGSTPTIADLNGTELASGSFMSVRIERRAQPAQERAWDSFNAAMRGGLAGAGFPQGDEVIDVNDFIPKESWTLVAPGVIVRSGEYDARYADLGLEGLKGRMSAEMFRTFVRYIGVLEGPVGVDVDQLVEEQSE